MAENCALVVGTSTETVSCLEGVLEELGFVSIICDKATRAQQIIHTVSPNLVILDLDQSPRDSMTLLSDLRDHGVHAPILWLAEDPSPQASERVRASGAQGLVRKDSDAPSMKFAIRTVLCGDLYFSPQLTSPATPGAKAVAESQRLMKILRQAERKQG